MFEKNSGELSKKSLEAHSYMKEKKSLEWQGKRDT